MPRRWAVELEDGTVVEVWADGFQSEGDHYTFSCLYDLDADEDVPEDPPVVGSAPSDPRRYLLAVARIPKAAVLLPDGDEEWPAISS